MKGKKQFLSILMVLAFVVALSASGVWGQDGTQGPEVAGPESPDTAWTDDHIGINKSNPTLFFYDRSGTNWRLKGYHDANPDWFELYDYTNNKRIFTVEAGGQTDSIFIEADGDVGLRTQNPAYNLDVQGTTPSFRVGSRLYYNDSSGRLTVNATGSNVAVWATSATYDAIRGYANNTSGNFWGVYGRSASPDGEGVMGQNTATTGVAHGVYGKTASASGIAVEGLASHTTGTNYGVHGRSRSTAGVGVFGLAEATTGTAVGVYGKSVSATGRGVYGLTSAATGATYGVLGRSQSTSGRGLYGLAAAASGTTYGVLGRSQSTSGRGLYGLAAAASGTTYGVYGRSQSTSGRGVYGDTSATSGTTYGVYGRSQSTSGRGIYGYASASSGNTTGVYGKVQSHDGWAGKFMSTAGNGVYISTPGGKTGLNVVGGTKNAVVRTNEGSRLLYAEESTEVWFSDHGFGQLQEGVAIIAINPLFAQTVNLHEPYHVFLEEYGNAELYVAKRGPEHFEVRCGRGDANVEFSYRLMAKRLGYEGERLAHAPWADDDPNLYPELREHWEAMEREMNAPSPEELEDGEAFDEPEPLPEEPPRPAVEETKPLTEEPPESAVD